MDALRRPREIMKAHLDLLKEHVHRQGKYGSGYLSYESGVTASDSGVLTWIFDAHNELDPTSNINVLNFLFLLMAAGYADLEAEIAFLIQGILRFLGSHVRENTFFHPRLQQYYPTGSTFFFWHRLQRSLDLLDAGVRARLDPADVLGKMNAYLKCEATRFFSPHAEGCSLGDFAMASPFLMRENLITKQDSLWFRDPNIFSHFRENQYEIFHLLYPVRVLCVTENIPLAAFLFFLVESEKIE
jgi:hypothetical protein